MTAPTTVMVVNAADLDALPEGDAAVHTLGGIWTKGDGENWHRAQRGGGQKVWPSSKLAPLVIEVIWPRAEAPAPSGHEPGCYPDPLHPGYWYCTAPGHPQGNPEAAVLRERIDAVLTACVEVSGSDPYLLVRTIREALECCPECGAGIEVAEASAPGYEGITYPRCSDFCGWVGEP